MKKKIGGNFWDWGREEFEYDSLQPPTIQEQTKALNMLPKMHPYYEFIGPLAYACIMKGYCDFESGNMEYPYYTMTKRELLGRRFEKCVLEKELKLSI